MLFYTFLNFLLHLDYYLKTLRTEQNGTRKAEVLNYLIMKIMANENDINDILQTFQFVSQTKWH